MKLFFNNITILFFLIEVTLTVEIKIDMSASESCSLGELHTFDIRHWIICHIQYILIQQHNRKTEPVETKKEYMIRLESMNGEVKKSSSICYACLSESVRNILGLAHKTCFKINTKFEDEIIIFVDVKNETVDVHEDASNRAKTMFCIIRNKFQEHRLQLLTIRKTPIQISKDSTNNNDYPKELLGNEDGNYFYIRKEPAENSKGVVCIKANSSVELGKLNLKISKAPDDVQSKVKKMLVEKYCGGSSKEIKQVIQDGKNTEDLIQQKAKLQQEHNAKIREKYKDKSEFLKNLRLFVVVTMFVSLYILRFVSIGILQKRIKKIVDAFNRKHKCNGEIYSY